MKKTNEETQELDTFLRTSALLVPTDLVQGTIDRFSQTEPGNKCFQSLFRRFFSNFMLVLKLMTVNFDSSQSYEEP